MPSEISVLYAKGGDQGEAAAEGVATAGVKIFGCGGGGN